jgi:hypothetical protein
MVEKSEIVPKSRSATYRRKALEFTAAGALLALIVGIALWLEADVLRKTTNGDGLVNLVLIAVVTVCVGTGLLVGQARRGGRVALDRICHWRRRA